MRSHMLDFFGWLVAYSMSAVLYLLVGVLYPLLWLNKHLRPKGGDRDAREEDEKEEHYQKEEAVV